MVVRGSIPNIRTVAVAAWLAIALTGQVGCAAAEPPISSEQVAPPVFLDQTRPLVRVSVEARRIGADVVGLLVPVIKVENPHQIAVQVQVSLEVGSGDNVRTSRLGSFSLFPADQPGTFTVPFARARLLAAAEGQSPPESFVVVFRVEPVATEEPLRDVRLEIGSLRWIS